MELMHCLIFSAVPAMIQLFAINLQNRDDPPQAERRRQGFFVSWLGVVTRDPEAGGHHEKVSIR